MWLMISETWIIIIIIVNIKTGDSNWNNLLLNCCLVFSVVLVCLLYALLLRLIYSVYLHETGSCWLCKIDPITVDGFMCPSSVVRQWRSLLSNGNCYSIDSFSFTFLFSTFNNYTNFITVEPVRVWYRKSTHTNEMDSFSNCLFIFLVGNKKTWKGKFTWADNGHLVFLWHLVSLILWTKYVESNSGVLDNWNCFSNLTFDIFSCLNNHYLLTPTSVEKVQGTRHKSWTKFIW